MSLIDFKEIPEAHIASGQQDAFELFAADFFEMLGYELARGLRHDAGRPVAGLDADDLSGSSMDFAFQGRLSGPSLESPETATDGPCQTTA